LLRRSNAGVSHIFSRPLLQGVPCTLCSTLIRHPKIEIKPKSESKDTNGEEAAKNSPGKRYHFHARCPAEWDEGNGSQSGDGDKGKPRKGWRWVRSAAHPSPSELWNINYNQLYPLPSRVV
jgi:hypothetical protein